MMLHQTPPLTIDVCGDSHLATTLRRAAQLCGFRTLGVARSAADLILVAQDVLDHSELVEAHTWFESALLDTQLQCQPVVLVSQVSPGTTRKWAGENAARVFYQVDTIIMKVALSRAVHPEQIVVGCADPDVPLPLAYQEYLLAHDCDVLQVTYEEAELAKCAINYMLSKQIEAANDIVTAARAVGADYGAIEAVLHRDARIGPYAYLKPGKTNQHLDRDIVTLLQLAHDQRMAESHTLPED